jgi:hypothetical protein
MFEKDKVLSYIPNPTFDANSKTITGELITSVNTATKIVYQFNGKSYFSQRL